MATTGRHAGPSYDVTRSALGLGAILLRATSAFLVAGSALLMLTAAVGVFVFHLGMSPVLTGSMRGAFDPGAAVITRPVPVSSIHRGDVVVFRPPGQSDSYAHRIVTVTAGTTGPVITTRGDANPAADPWRAQLSGPTAQQVVLSVPHLGRALVALHEPRTHSFALVLAGLVFSALGVRAVVGHRPAAPARRTFVAPLSAG